MKDCLPKVHWLSGFMWVQARQHSEEKLTRKMPQLRVSPGPGLLQNFRRAHAMQVFYSMSIIHILCAVCIGLNYLGLAKGN